MSRVSDMLIGQQEEAADELLCEIDRLKEINAELLSALEAAEGHLDYCGYGDSWERECALHGEPNLPTQIDAALTNARAFLEGKP